MIVWMLDLGFQALTSCCVISCVVLFEVYVFHETELPQHREELESHAHNCAYGTGVFCCNGLYSNS